MLPRTNAAPDLRRFRIYDCGIDGEARIVQFLQRDGGEGLTPDIQRTVALAPA